jgi:hypothetical protein
MVCAWRSLPVFSLSYSWTPEPCRRGNRVARQPGRRLMPTGPIHDRKDRLQHHPSSRCGGFCTAGGRRNQPAQRNSSVEARTEHISAVPGYLEASAQGRDRIGAKLVDFSRGTLCSLCRAGFRRASHPGPDPLPVVLRLHGRHARRWLRSRARRLFHQSCGG